MGGVLGLWSGKSKNSHSDESDGKIEPKKSGYPRLIVDGRLDSTTIRLFLIHEAEGLVWGLLRVQIYLPGLLTIVILSRTLFYDEDGDVANEFYEEVELDGGRRRALRRITRNLRPQVGVTQKKTGESRDSRCSTET
jgi:hypothetical protein